MPDPRPALRVVLADDHPLYRAGLARALRHDGLVVVAEAPNAGAAVRAVGETAADVVVMDLNMPGGSGLHAARRVSEDHPGTHVLVLTVSAEPSDVAAAISAGAGGYLLKDDPLESIAIGVRSITTGVFPLSLRLVRHLVALGDGLGQERWPVALQLGPRPGR